MLGPRGNARSPESMRRLSLAPVAQLGERRYRKPEVRGSIPRGGSIFAALAQSVERQPSKLEANSSRRFDSGRPLHLCCCSSIGSSTRFLIGGLAVRGRPAAPSPRLWATIHSAPTTPSLAFFFWLSLQRRACCCSPQCPARMLPGRGEPGVATQQADLPL